MTGNLSPRIAVLPLAIVVVVIAGAALCMSVFAAFNGAASASEACGLGAGASLGLGPARGGRPVGATEYGGPGAPTPDVGSEGVNLVRHPDSYAELGGTDFDTARAMGGLPYGAALRITWGRHSVVAYKRDIGLGGGPIDGHPRVIDLWWLLARRLGIPYEDGDWSGTVRIERVSAAANIPANANANASTSTDGSASAIAAGTCMPADGGSGVAITSGPRAKLLASGLAAAPAAAPRAVKGIIAAGNQIVGKPYVYGGGHGLPLSQIAPSYDCSSSVAHLLYGGGLLSVGTDMTSGEFESWGAPGPGRWVTIYASGDHVFMYVAGLRWDTHNAAGPGDGSAGIGWHPLVREDAGFVVRHPVGL